jgi:hypothetical protein
MKARFRPSLSILNPSRMDSSPVRVIAFFLPQYHPIPENDSYWGKGFTEWSNVVKARPLFKGHDQPFLPSDLGFYDLRVPEVREQQAALARQAGIEGFCYWHYWFGNGKRALETILEQVSVTGKPDFPFCLGWANESWTGKWHGLDDEVIFEQTYPGNRDYFEHFQAIVHYFKDSRYIRVNDKPVFLVYRPELLPSFADFKKTWDALAAESGLTGIHWISNGSNSGQEYIDMGFDGFAINNLSSVIEGCQGNLYKKLRRLKRLVLGIGPTVLRYESYVNHERMRPVNSEEYPVIYPNWDNTPRLGDRGYVLSGSDHVKFAELLKHSIQKVAGRPFQDRLVFLKSWNEWAEGNTLEPSIKHGTSYLDACAEILNPRR